MSSILFRMPDPEPAPSWTDREWAAIDGHLRRTGTAMMRAVLLGSVCLNALLGYIAWTHPAGVLPALYLGLIALALGVLFGPGATELRRAPTALGLVVLVPTSAGIGLCLGSDPGPQVFPWLFLLGPITSLFVVRIGARIGITAALTGFAVLGYLLAAGPEAWQSAVLPSQLSFLGFVVVISVCNGHFLLWVSAGSALKGIRREERRATLAAATGQLADQVSGQRTELGALTAHLMQVRDRERLTLGREIRAELAPELGGLRRCIEAMEDDPAPDQIETLLVRSKAGMGRTHIVFRRILNRLHPMLLERLGIKPALRWLAEDAGRRCGVPVRLDVDLAGVSLSDEEDQLIFRTVRDGLRRAEAAGPPTAWQVRVRPHPEGDTVLVEVSDDAGGGEWDPDTAGVLLVGVREQVAASGGVVSWSEVAGGEWLLRAEIPMWGDR